MRWRRSTPRWTGAGFRCRHSIVYAHGNGALSLWVGENRDNVIRGGITLTPTDVFVGGSTPWHGLADVVADLRMSRKGHQQLTAAVACCVPGRHRPAGIDALIDALVNGARRGSAIERFTTLGVAIAWVCRRKQPANRGEGLTLLIDDIENHLHPSWEREALDGIQELQAQAVWDDPVQVIATTNAPMLLAGAEAGCNPQRDLLATLVSAESGTRIVEGPLTRQGTVGRWLMSDAIGLESDRNIAAEQAIAETKRIMIDGSTDKTRVAAADAALRRALPDDDAFWPRWRYFAETILDDNETTGGT